MSIIRTRESVSEMPSSDYLAAKQGEGWSLAALVWEREVPDDQDLPDTRSEEVPYGLQIAASGDRLEENPEEMETLTGFLDLIVSERSLSEVVSALNAKGYRSRDGNPWKKSDVFQLLPRLIEATPRIFSDETWSSKSHRHGPAAAAS